MRLPVFLRWKWLSTKRYLKNVDEPSIFKIFNLYDLDRFDMVILKIILKN
jgi:hypothetical protein